GGVIPLVLASGVDVRVIFPTHHAHGLCTTGTQAGDLHAHILGHVDRDLRGGVLADDEAVVQLTEVRLRPTLPVVRRAVDGVHLRHADRGFDDLAVDRESDVHGPVVAGARVFAGAVQRVDHPHPGLVQAGGVVFCLLGEDGVVGAVQAQHTRD